MTAFIGMTRTCWVKTVKKFEVGFIYTCMKIILVRNNLQAYNYLMYRLYSDKKFMPWVYNNYYSIVMLSFN